MDNARMCEAIGLSYRQQRLRDATEKLIELPLFLLAPAVRSRGGRGGGW